MWQLWPLPESFKRSISYHMNNQKCRLQSRQKNPSYCAFDKPFGQVTCPSVVQTFKDITMLSSTEATFLQFSSNSEANYFRKSGKNASQVLTGNGL